jgi:nitroimidazol reductase NimA-like FMN-containing flavoprotein (pyridoxamine 5'-phosphate oxidase superfamily)
MTSADWWWALNRRAGRLEELDLRECRRLLSATDVGRLGYTGEAGPRIVPVNYALLPESVVFRTGQQSEIARFALGRTVAFEVDQVDEFLHSGWSVLIVGRLSEMSPSAIEMLDVSDTPQPWPKGTQTLVCEVSLSEVTGRRVLPGG